MLLADAAQAVDGKLYVLGGGWSVTGPEPAPMAIALKIDVPWDEANKRHKFQLALLDADGQPVIVPTPTGERPFELTGEFETGRPAGLKDPPFLPNGGFNPRDEHWRRPCRVKLAPPDLPGPLGELLRGQPFQ